MGVKPIFSKGFINMMAALRWPLVSLKAEAICSKTLSKISVSAFNSYLLW